MPREASMLDDVRARLRDAGFRLIQVEDSARASGGDRPDALAWAASAEGALVPWALIEVKSGRVKSPDSALPALARGRDLLGTVDHYAVINGEWFKADVGVRSMSRVDGPDSPMYGVGGVLGDEAVATSLLVRQLWREADRARGHEAFDGLPPSGASFTSMEVTGIEISGRDFIPVRPDVLWRARRSALLSFTASTADGGIFTSSPVIARAVAYLVESRLEGTVLDPFCGTGSFLWAAMDRLSIEATAEFVGMDVNPRLAELAQVIGQSAPKRTTIALGNAFEAALPHVDVVITAPPMGMRLPTPRVLLDGSTTMDASVAAVDLALRCLNPSGRAVIHVAANFTFLNNAERYRQFLASEFRIAALIGLPSGAVPGTGVRSVLMVIERTPPGETFVAQLAEDWPTHLTPGGAALTAAREHIDTTQSAG